MGYKSICGMWARFVLGCDETSDQKRKPFVGKKQEFMELYFIRTAGSRSKLENEAPSLLG